MGEKFPQGVALKIGERDGMLLGAVGRPAEYTLKDVPLSGVQFTLNGREFFRAASGGLYTVGKNNS